MSFRALIVLLLVASGASAEDKRPTWDASYAFGGNFEQIGGAGYSGITMQIQLARRVADWLAIAASAELASAMDDDDVEGGIMRGLAGVDIYVLQGDGLFVPALLVSVGSGTETVAWDRGTLTRSMSYVGVEYRASMRVGGSGFIRNLSHLGFRFGVRGTIAPGVSDTTVAKLCTSCMAEETPDRGIDLGVAFYMGLVFGR